MPSSAPSQQQNRRLLMLDSPEDPVIYDLVLLAQADNSFEVRFCDIPILQKLLQEDPQSIFFATIDSVEKLKSLVHVFKAHLRPRLKTGQILALAFNRLNHHDVPRILKKMGFTEVVSSHSIKSEGLKLRVEELFERFLVVNPEVNSAEEPSRERPSGLVIRECRLQVLEPLVTDSDCWLLRRPQDIRIVNDQWIIDLIGPGPSAGKWSRVEPLTERTPDGHGTWKWEPSSKVEGLVKKNGIWVFEGRRPHFNEFHWTFTGRSPRLSYLENSEPVCDYFSVGPNQTLLIASNSEIAQKKWPAIHASVLNEYRYSVLAQRIATPNWTVVLSDDKPVPWRQLMGLEAPEKAAPPSRHQMIRKIQESTAPQEELFSKVEDPAVREGLIREMSQRQCSALVWTTGQRIRFGAKVRDAKDSNKALLIDIPAGLGSQELMNALEADGSRLFVNVSLQRGGVFFVANEVYLRESSLELILPPVLYQVQRRSHFRLSVPEEKGMYIRIGDQFHRILNLSGGGLAFATSSANKAVFMKGAILTSLSFQIYDEKIHCKGEVRWSKELPEAPEGSELTVGVQFYDMRPADEQKLNLYVLEEGFEYFRQHVLSV